MSAARAIRRRFLEALLEEEVELEDESRRTAPRAATVDVDAGTAVVRTLRRGDQDLVRIELPLTTLMTAVPELIARGREWFATGSDVTDAVAPLLIALDEAVDSEALDGADDLVLDVHGLFAPRRPPAPSP